MKSKRTQAERTAGTRAALVAAARPLFAAKGYGAVGTDEVAGAAGVTRGALYHQFGGKEELFAAVLEQVEEEMVQRIAEVLADAIERGRAYLDAGASTFFAPGLLDEATVAALVDALGPQKVNLIGIPGSLSLETMQRLGVARVSYGPWSQNVALTALADLAAAVRDGGGIPESTRKLN